MDLEEKLLSKVVALNITMISVAHRQSVVKYHSQIMEVGSTGTIVGSNPSATSNKTKKTSGAPWNIRPIVVDTDASSSVPPAAV